MPIISVDKSIVEQELGSTLSEEEPFSDLLFDYGLELDEVEEDLNCDPVKTTYRVELPANRYDLLSAEGLLRALKVFTGQWRKSPVYKRVEPKNREERIELTVETTTQQVRPFCVSAVLRDVTLSPVALASFIDLQDKLHLNLGRRRTLVAIGTHDLDTLKPPFVYKAEPPREIKFKPLNQKREFTAEELMEFYKSDLALRGYLKILENEPLYPVIYDSQGIVCSMPPIINGDHSKISVSTKNIFIECTATDETKAKVVLNTIVTLFSQYCANQFTVEPVNVVYDSCYVNDRWCISFPQFSYRTEVISGSMANKKIGVNIPIPDMARLLTKMCLSAELQSDGDTIKVTIPPTRADVLHACDIYEDIAIAFGYNNIEKVFPSTNTVAHQLPVNKLSDKLKENVAMSGYTEVFTFSLCSRADISTSLGRENEEEALKDAVQVSNPATNEFQVVRTSLIPGLLKTVASNRKMALPLKLFELSDIVLLDTSRDVGARNERRLAAIFYGKTSGFEVIHGLLDRIMQLLEVKNDDYSIQEAKDPIFFPGRCAEIVCSWSPNSEGDNKKTFNLGKMGVVHPSVLKNFDLNYPCSVLEINVEPFVL